MSKGEMVDVLNAEGEITGSMSRAEAEQGNHATPNVLIFVFSSLGRVWVGLRPEYKPHYPGRWDISACGGVKSGESVDAAAEREAWEETALIGLKLHFIEKFLNEFSGDDGEKRKRWSHLYVTISDEIPKPSEEVTSFKEWHLDALIADFAANPDKYVPSLLVELGKAVVGYEAIKSKIL